MIGVSVYNAIVDPTTKGLGDSKNSDNSEESKSDKSSRKNSYDCGSESDGEDKKDARYRGD